MRLINSDGQIVDSVEVSEPSAPVAVSSSKSDGGKSTLLVLCGMACGLTLAMGLVLALVAYKSERETRMLEYYVNEVDGKLIHAGLIEPRERWSPEKRKQYEETKP